MKRATRDVLYFETGPDNAPTLRVAPGEVFEVETQLNRGPWLDDHPQGEELRKVLEGAKELAKDVDIWAQDAGGYAPAWFDLEKAIAAAERDDE